MTSDNVKLEAGDDYGPSLLLSGHVEASNGQWKATAKEAAVWFTRSGQVKINVNELISVSVPDKGVSIKPLGRATMIVVVDGVIDIRGRIRMTLIKNGKESHTEANGLSLNTESLQLKVRGVRSVQVR